MRYYYLQAETPAAAADWIRLIKESKKTAVWTPPLLREENARSA